MVVAFMWVDLRGIIKDNRKEWKEENARLWAELRDFQKKVNQGEERMKLSRYFQRNEFICNGIAKGICNCNYDSVDMFTFKYLNMARTHFDRPLIINSAARCLTYNRYIGSEDTSQHVAMRAVDHYIKDVPLVELYQFYEEAFGDHRFGLGLYDSFIHIDTRTNGPARWHFSTSSS